MLLKIVSILYFTFAAYCLYIHTAVLIEDIIEKEEFDLCELINVLFMGGAMFFSALQIF